MSQTGRYSKILVAIDGSSKSLEAAEQGIAMAKKDNARLVILNVIHTPASTLLYSTEKSFNEFVKKSNDEARVWFDKIREKSSAIGVELKTETIEEIYSVPGAIIKYAEKEKVDLIIVGGTGRSGFKELLLASVSNDVERKASCQVLVIQ